MALLKKSFTSAIGLSITMFTWSSYLSTQRCLFYATLDQVTDASCLFFMGDIKKKKPTTV